MIPRRSRLRGSLRLAALACALWAAQQAMALTIGRMDLELPLVRIHERVVSEACRRAGIPVRYVPLPLLRSIASADSGEIDGDLYRIADVVQQYPNLMMVPTPIGHVDVAIYGATPQIANMSRADILRLRLGAPRGVFVLAKHSPASTLHLGRAGDAPWLMLVNGRVDAVITPYIDVEVTRQAGGVPGMYLWPHLWATEPLYLVLNRREAAAAARIDEELRKMQREGFIERTYRDEVKRLGIPELLPE